MSFYSNFLEQCAKFNLSPTAVAVAIGLSNAAATGWKKGKQPSDVTLQKLSDFFGCSIFDLTGEMEQKEKPAQVNGPNKDMLLAWIETASRDELIEALQAVTNKLSEK
ncbi:MAG: helix-turn-helix transcriptional regulator [Oscillospiraceae bacterium]|nr:helix-turn-helix transcriptional regulator [Oscillospiraceae bacterium]